MFLAKGRDMGFNQVLGSFQKLTAGTGAQLLTRQKMRLHAILKLPEALSLFYAHEGFCIGSLFISRSVPLLIDLWLSVMLSEGRRNLAVMDPRYQAI